MMRCIESAIAAGHIQRTDGEALQGQIEALIREGLSPADLKERLTADLEAKALEVRRRGLLQEAKRRILTEAVLTHKNARGENDPAEALWMLMEHHGRAGFQDIETRRQVVLATAHRQVNAVLKEFQKGAFSGDLRRQQEQVAARMDNLVRELFGTDTGDVSAKGLAKAWTEAAEYLRQRYNRAGGGIRKLEQWGLPQHHDQESLIKAGKTAWVDYMLRDGVLDRDKTVSPLTGERYTDVELRETLDLVWERITTDGWIDREARSTPFGRGVLGSRLDDHHRFLHFKSADEWLAYQRAFGNGDPFSAMVGYLGVMARDIATMEVLGPNPEAMRNYLKQLVLKQAAQAKPVQRVIRDETDQLRKLMRTLAGDKAGDDWVERLQAGLARLADVERRVRAQGRTYGPTLDELKAASADVDGLKRELDLIEARAFADRRATLLADIERLDGLLKIEGEKRQPGGRPSRRVARKIAELAAERQKAVDALDQIEQTDTSIGAELPAEAREVFQAVERMRAEALKIDLDAGGVPEGFRAVKEPMDAARSAIQRHDAMWELIRGTRYAPVNARFANTMQTFRNLLTANLLGSAMVSALADIAFQRHARRFAGLPVSTFGIIGEYVDMLAHHKARKYEAVEAGLILDSALHVMHAQSRYMDTVQTSVPGSRTIGDQAVAWSGFLADRVIAYSGLSAYTQAGKHAFGMAFQLEVGKRVGVEWRALPDVLRTTFERHGIDSADWDKMRGAALHAPRDGVVLLRPNEIETHAGEAVAEKYLAMILRETKFAVPEGTVRSRTWFGAGRPGTILGELGRNFGQFKSFGVAVVLLHGERMAAEWQAGRTGHMLSQIGGFALFGGMMGALVMELKELKEGRDPVLPTMLKNGKSPDWKYWGAALLQAGGLGIYGDFLFANNNRMGGGLASTLIGPVGGFLDRTRTRLSDEVGDVLNAEPQKLNLGRFAVQEAGELLPGRTLWYTRFLYERMFLNQLQNMVDPQAAKAWQRMQQNQQKFKGNEYWWKPGDMGPSRAPLAFQSRGSDLPASEKKRGLEDPGRVIGTLEQSPSRKFNVVDGDTIEVGGHRYRIEGLDAPEIYSRAAKGSERREGVRAAVRLEELLRTGKGARVELYEKTDAWGRRRARLTIDGKDAADILTGEGLARRKTSDGGAALLYRHLAQMADPDSAGVAQPTAADFARLRTSIDGEKTRATGVPEIDADAPDGIGRARRQRAYDVMLSMLDDIDEDGRLAA